MDSELTPEERFNAEDPEKMVPRALLAGRNRADIVTDLVRLDWTPAEAVAYVDRVATELGKCLESPESRAEVVRKCRQEMIQGGAIAIVGFFFAFVTTFGAGQTFVFGSVILTGLVLAIRGFSKWRFYRGDSIPPNA